MLYISIKPCPQLSLCLHLKLVFYKTLFFPSGIEEVCLHSSSISLCLSCWKVGEIQLNILWTNCLRSYWFHLVNGQRVILEWWLTAEQKDKAIFLKIPVEPTTPQLRSNKQVDFSVVIAQPGARFELSHAIVRLFKVVNHTSNRFLVGMPLEIEC